VRGMVPGLSNSYPLLLGLPAVYHDDSFTSRFVSAFDDVLAPVLGALDSLDAYLDPHRCPPDFLPWLAGWVGLELDPNWSLEQQRRLVSTAVEHARWHGTRRGVAELVGRYVDVDPDAVDVSDSGGATWSATADGAVPGEPVARLTVRVRVPDPEQIDADRLQRLVARTTPAHVVSTVEVVAA
jgi:phage tail-like protein